MSLPPLTVRNLTTKPLILKQLETFEDPRSQQSKPTSFFFGTGRNTTSAAPASPQLGEHAQTFTQREINIKISPFDSYTLPEFNKSTHSEKDAPSPTTTTTTTVRLTLETRTGERHRIDTNPTYTQKSSHPFTPLSPSPSTTFSALYHPGKGSSNPHLTIHTNHSHNLKSWMSSLPATLPLSALSIPGTHNSHTYYRALPSVRCQNVPVKTQLENGIRFLDIRAQPVHAGDASKKDMYLVHGAFPVSLTGPKYLSPVLDTCYQFLRDHPSETILVSLKREGVGKSTDELFSEILERHYFAPNREKWYTGQAVPYLGDVRGKMVLVRRYGHHSPSQQTEAEEKSIFTPHGLDATAWPHNSTHALHGPFCVQDFCEVMLPSSIPQKLTYSTEHLSRAAACTAFIPGYNTDTNNPVPAGPLYLNFLTGSNFWRKECWPAPIADVVNRGVEEWICRGLGVEEEEERAGGEENGRLKGDGALYRASEGDRSTGIVVMDNVGEGGDWDLVRLIVGCNNGILMKMGVLS